MADIRSLRLGRLFGGLLAWDSLFHLAPPDQRLMFPIFRAHAEPDSPLLFTSGPASGETLGTLEGEPLYHASLDPDEYNLLLDRNGFDAVAYRPEDPDCGMHTVWLARRREDGSPPIGASSPPSSSRDGNSNRDTAGNSAQS